MAEGDEDRADDLRRHDVHLRKGPDLRIDVDSGPLHRILRSERLLLRPEERWRRTRAGARGLVHHRQYVPWTGTHDGAARHGLPGSRGREALAQESAVLGCGDDRSLDGVHLLAGGVPGARSGPSVVVREIETEMAGCRAPGSGVV